MAISHPFFRGDLAGIEAKSGSDFRRRRSPAARGEVAALPQASIYGKRQKLTIAGWETADTRQ